MSPDDLLWAAPERGGLTFDEWELVVNHLTEQLCVFLGQDVCRSSDAFISPGKSYGFSVDFWSSAPITSPLSLQVRGTFGASRYTGTCSDYVAVQGWLYPYIDGRRTMTTLGSLNHIFLRYLKADARDSDWEMPNCTGDSAWRSLGWGVDEHDEFGGLDFWEGNFQR
jgi:hypothetical protein